MKCLYVLYDEKCELCKRLKDWLLGRACWIELHVVPANHQRIRQMFPGLERIATAGDLVVISDAGEVYLNNRAWIMALYALEEYRDWAVRLASPLLQPLARQGWEMLTRNREVISRWMRSSEHTVAQELTSVAVSRCETCVVTTTSAAPAEASQQHTTDTVRDYLQ